MDDKLNKVRQKAVFWIYKPSAGWDENSKIKQRRFQNRV